MDGIAPSKPLAETRDHLRVLADLDPEKRAWLLERSNFRGLVHLWLHFGMIIVLAALIARRVPYWPLLLLPQGVLIMFLFTAMHEATHLTAFRSEPINRAVAAVAGFLTLVAPGWFRFFHFAHHRHTHEIGRDPELQGGKPAALAAYLIYLSGIPVWLANIKVLIGNGRGKVTYAYVPEKARRRLVNEARIMIFAYAVLLLGSLALQNGTLLYVWLLPALVGQPFLRAYLLAEHMNCPHVANMLENSRTTFTSRLVRLVAWNMPYHAEHHALPNVPFWKLPAFHVMVKEHLRITEQGYGRFHRRLASDFIRGP
jgi:fatty acid desaturase